MYNLTTHPSTIKYMARHDHILAATSVFISNEHETRRMDAAGALNATQLFLETRECLDYIHLE